MRVTSIFFFSHNVFRRPFPHGHQKSSLCGKGLIFIISYFPVEYREICEKIFFDLTLVAPVKIPIFMFSLPRLIAHASQPDGNMTSFTLHFSRLM